MKALADEWRDVDEAEVKPFAALTVRRLSEILQMTFSPDDFILENGYVAKGDAIAICGAAGVGKTRLCMQMVIALLTGRDFLGWKTRGKGTRWLIIQTENSNRRLQHELSAMLSSSTEEERRAVDEGMVIHTLECDTDSFLSLNIAENEARISALIQEINPAGVIYDVLRDFGIGDLNGDADMTATLSAIGRITRRSNPQRIPIVVHHALTGKSGAARAIGYDRGSFGRNSKVLLGWVRAQINVAPHGPDSNEVLVVASGKCNNAEEFLPFAVRLDPDTMTYERDDSVDVEAWKERIGTSSGKPRRESKVTIGLIKQIVESVGLDGMSKKDIISSVKAETGVTSNYPYDVLDKAEAQKAVVRRKCDHLYVVPKC